MRFLTVLFISETLCIALQSPAFLTDLWNLAKISLLVASSFLYHAALSGYYIANALGWLNRGDYLYYAGWLLQAAFPLCILIALFVLVKVVLPKHRSRSREAKRDRHIPRMLGIHVVCAAMVIALCTAGRIPKYHGIRINSVFIPIIAYLIWLLISRYYEGGWWFKGWDENTRNWW